MSNPLIEQVRDKYAAAAGSSLSSDHAGVRAVAQAFGYTPAELAHEVMAYIGCIAGAVFIADYELDLRAAGFDAVQVVDSHKDLNAYALVENQAGCCSPPMTSPTLLPLADACCTPPAAGVH